MDISPQVSAILNTGASGLLRVAALIPSWRDENELLGSDISSGAKLMP